MRRWTVQHWLRCLGCLVCFLLPIVSVANLNSDLHHFFNGLGYASNTTLPTAYHGQQAGFYSGGSLYLRRQVRNVSIAHVDLPQVNAGCGGIDVYLGGFSYINADGMKTLMQNIMHGAEGYVAELALEQMIPQATNVMRHMQTIANRINQFNINACHSTAQLVGATGLRTQESQQNICASAAVAQGRASSWTNAVALCRDPNHYHTIMMQAKHNPQYQSMIVDNTNVAWAALMKNAFLRSDPQLAELFMSLSGTIIVQHGQARYVPSKVNNKSLLHALLHGGQAPIWRCDTTNSDGCLHPSEGTIVIQPQASLAGQVNALLQDMITHIQDDTPLTQTEMGFLQATRLPIYKMLNVQAAYHADHSVLDLTSFTDLIATDLLTQYLQESLAVVRAQSVAMQYPPSILQPFLQGIDRAMAAVRAQAGSAYRQTAQVNALVARTQMMERLLADSLAHRLVDHVSWADGVH